MIEPNTLIYLETSAVNYMADKYHSGDAKATKIYHKLKGTKFYASPVTVWEILLTTNEDRRETLIQYLQNIGHDKLLNSPSEFMINYLLAGCPMVEKHYDFHTTLSLGKTWTDICENTNKTFVFDRLELKAKSDMFLTAFKLASKKIEEINLITPENADQIEDQIWLNEILKNLKGIDFDEMTDRNKKIYKISILLMLYILCAGMDMDNTYIEKYWSKVGVNDTKKRLDYLIRNHELLIYRGPLPIVSQMALIQLEKGGKPTRGIFWDMLHSIYLIYVNMFFTNDAHFKKLRESHEHIIFKRIVHLEEVEFFAAKQIEILPNKIIK